MSLPLPTTPGHVSLPQHKLRIWTTLETLGKRVPEYFWYCLGMKLNLEQSICSISEKKSCISLACTSFINLGDGCCSRSLWKLFWSSPVLPAPNTLSISFLLLFLNHILFILWKLHTLMQCSLFLSINPFLPASLSAPVPRPKLHVFLFCAINKTLSPIRTAHCSWVRDHALGHGPPPSVHCKLMCKRRVHA